LSEFGSYNKLNNILYFKFNVESGKEGVHKITIKPENSDAIIGCDLLVDGNNNFYNYNVGTFPRNKSNVLFPKGDLVFSTPYLKAGDVVFRVFTALGNTYESEPISVLVEK